MIWEPSEFPSVTRAKLLLASPETVFTALEHYGARVRKSRIGGGADAELEQGLTGRHDRLIDLGLAANASDHRVIATLYARALAGSGDAAYDKAVRLACLSNECVGGIFNDTAVDDYELSRLAKEGDDEELLALFTNPKPLGLLTKLYRAEAPFNGLSEDRWGRLVRCSIGNPGINRDESNEHGPDLTVWDLHKAIAHLVANCPMTSSWAWTLHALLMTMDSHVVSRPEAIEAARDMANRWIGVKVEKRFAIRDEDRGKDEEGHYTDLSLVDELRCLIAAIYGRVFAGGKFELIGSTTDADVAMRCASYGSENLKLDKMGQAVNKDRQVFAMAALFNDNFYFDKGKRAFLEGCIGGNLAHLYTRRCAQIHLRRQTFDPAPVGGDLSLDEEVPRPRQPADEAAVRRLEETIAALSAKVATIHSTVLWGLIVLGGLLLWRR